MSLPFASVNLDHEFPTAGEWVSGRITHDSPQPVDYRYEISTDNDAVTKINKKRVLVRAGETKSQSFILHTDPATCDPTYGHVYASGRPRRGIAREARRAPVDVYPRDRARIGLRPVVKAIGAVSLNPSTVVAGNSLEHQTVSRTELQDMGLPERLAVAVTPDHARVTAIINEVDGRPYLVSFAADSLTSQEFRIETDNSGSPSGHIRANAGPMLLYSSAPLDVTDS